MLAAMSLLLWNLAHMTITLQVVGSAPPLRIGLLVLDGQQQSGSQTKTTVLG
jgi:hypothetical protein